MSDVLIKKKNESYIEIITETSTLYELQDCFTFYADGYKFHPRFRSKHWDGKIRLLKLISKNKGELYYGLLQEVIKFCTIRDYSYEIAEDVKHIPPEKELIEKFLEYITISSKGEKIELRDYQIKGIIDAIQSKRILIKSPTASGKSAIIYTIIRFLKEKGLKGLILVPNISLIHQLHNDFIDYSQLNNWNADKYLHKIYSGQDKESSKQIFLSTWQSLQKGLPNSFFEQFDYIICDECFSGTTKILTRDGYVEIKNIKIGDVIINYNENEKIFKEDVVEKIHKNISKNEKMYELEFDNNIIIKVTGNHKFLTTNGWIRADELTEEHEIVNYGRP